MNVAVPPERTRPSESPAFTGAAAVLIAAGLFTVLTRWVLTGASEPFDTRVREAAQRHRSTPGDILVRPVTLLSMPLIAVGASATLALWLREKNRGRAALTVAIAPFAAAIFGQTCTWLLPQRNPPHLSDDDSGEMHATFPSGHTTGITAEYLTMAYVLASEGLVSSGTVAGLIACPVLVGVGRLYRDRHWASDVLAAWIAGTGIAAAMVLFYRQGRATQ